MAGRPRKYSDSDLALAYELHQSGVQWKFISIGLGIDHNSLRLAVQRRLMGIGVEVKHG